MKYGLSPLAGTALANYNQSTLVQAKASFCVLAYKELKIKALTH